MDSQPGCGAGRAGPLPPEAGQQRHLLSDWAPGFCVARGCTGSGECVLGQVFQAEARWARELRRNPQVSAPGWLHPSTITTTALLANGKGPFLQPPREGPVMGILWCRQGRHPLGSPSGKGLKLDRRNVPFTPSDPLLAPPGLGPCPGQTSPDSQLHPCWAFAGALGPPLVSAVWPWLSGYPVSFHISSVSGSPTCARGPGWVPVMPGGPEAPSLSPTSLT